MRSAGVCSCYISNQLRFIGSRSTLSHPIYLFTDLWPPANTFLLAPSLPSYILQSSVFLHSEFRQYFWFLGSWLEFYSFTINDQGASSASRIFGGKETTNFSWKMANGSSQNDSVTLTEFHHWPPKGIRSIFSAEFNAILANFGQF